MDQIKAIFTSWQFLVVGFAVFLLFAFFNGFRSWKGIGYYLWATKVRFIRQFLKFMEAVKVLFLPIMGFGLGWIPQIPRPPQLEEATQFSVALVYAVAGLCSMLIVKFGKKALEALGIDVDDDLTPSEQKKRRAG